MIESWSSTLWEEFPANNSNNHAWSAGPVFHLSSAVLGITPTKPKYSEFSFLPKMGNLTQVSGSLPTPYGPVAASCTRVDFTFTQAISVPPNTTALVGIPRQLLQSGRKIKSIKARGSVIWSDGKVDRKVKQLTFYKEDDQYILFKAQQGSWQFVAEYHDI
jgi:hypothetical protein